MRKGKVSHRGPEVTGEGQRKKSLFASIAKPSTENNRPSSMVIKKAHTVIPAEIVAEAISTLRGLDLRWSGPITPTEMQYVEQYVLAKYPQYAGLVGEKIDLSTLCIGEDPATAVASQTSPDKDDKRKSPRVSFRDASSPSNGSNVPDLDRTQLENSRLLDILTMKSSFPGSFISIPAPETWLDLRIKGSQLSQYFRRKCKHSLKGLFSYPADVNGTRYSMHWVSEAHRNSWHVLLDATAFVAGKDKLNLTLHRPDFVLCSPPDNTQSQPSSITCLLVRKKSFDTSTSSIS